MFFACNAIRTILLAALVVAPLAAGAATVPTTPRALLLAAREAMDREEHAEAQSLARRLLSGHPQAEEAVDAWLVLVDALRAQGKHLAAFEECEKLLAAHRRTRRRSDVLRREFEIGKALAQARSTVLVFRYSHLEDAVRVLEKIVEHAPYGALADDAVFALAEAYHEHKQYEDALAHYERLLRNYRTSPLRRRAIIGRAACNYHLTEGAPYDPRPAREAARDFDRLARAAGGAEEVARRRDALEDIIARGRYDAALFYFRNENIEAGLRTLESVLSQYPRSTYAARARRILQDVILKEFPDTEYAERARRALARIAPEAATSKEKP